NIVEIGSEDTNRRRRPGDLDRGDRMAGELLLAADLVVDPTYEVSVHRRDTELANQLTQTLECLTSQNVTAAQQGTRQLELLARFQGLGVSHARPPPRKALEGLDHGAKNWVLSMQIETHAMRPGNLLQIIQVSEKSPMDSVRIITPILAKQTLPQYGRALLRIGSIELERTSDIGEERSIVFEYLVANQAQDAGDLGKTLWRALEKLSQRRTTIVLPDPIAGHRDPEGHEDRDRD